MLIKRAIVLSLSFLALPSCSVVEDILSGISGFVDVNDDGPLFAYATDQNPPSVLIAVITDADAGLVLQGVSPSPDMSKIDNIVLSPDGRFVGGNYNLLIGDDIDVGMFVINPRTDSVEVFETDNTVNLDRRISCRLPDLQVMADALARNYVDVVFPDHNIPPENVTGVIEVAEEDSGNTLSFSGWNGLQSFVARYDLLADVEVVVADPPIRLPYDIGPIPRIEGILHYQRTAGGS
jgi:hypothetical protein